MAPMRRCINGKTPEQIRQMKEAGQARANHCAPRRPSRAPGRTRARINPPCVGCPQLDVSLTVADFEDAVGRIQPSVSSNDSARFEAWAKEFGSV